MVLESLGLMGMTGNVKLKFHNMHSNSITRHVQLALKFRRQRPKLCLSLTHVITW